MLSIRPLSVCLWRSCTVAKRFDGSRWNLIGTQVGLGPGHIVLGGAELPSPKGAQQHRPPIFGVYLLRPSGCLDQDATRHGARPRPRRLCVRWGPSFPSPKRGRRPSPQFSAHVHCGQTAGCIELPLGVEVGLSPGDFVTDGDPVPPPQKGAEPPIFSPCLLWSNGCMDQCWLVWR